MAVSPARGRGPIHPQTLGIACRAACEFLGEKRVTVHTLRHNSEAQIIPSGLPDADNSPDGFSRASTSSAPRHWPKPSRTCCNLAGPYTSTHGVRRARRLNLFHDLAVLLAGRFGTLNGIACPSSPGNDPGIALSGEGFVRVACSSICLSSHGQGKRLLSKAELGRVGPHTMQNDSQFAATATGLLPCRAAWRCSCPML